MQVNTILSSRCNIYLTEELQEGILKPGCFHKLKDMGVDEGLLCGDYYFIAAFMNLERKIE